MEFDFSRLRGRMVEKFGSVSAVAKVLDMPASILSSRITNRTPLKPEEIYALAQPSCLDIPDEEIGAYFFTPKVR